METTNATKRKRKVHKAWYKSWTVWFNIISVLALAVESQLQLLQSLMGEAEYALVAILVAAVNLYLRMHSGARLHRVDLPDQYCHPPDDEGVIK